MFAGKDVMAGAAQVPNKPLGSEAALGKGLEGMRLTEASKEIFLFLFLFCFLESLAASQADSIMQ